MSYKRNISNYIDEVNVQTAKTGLNTRFSPVVFLLSVFSAAFIMLLAIQPVFNGAMNRGSGTSANAFGITCSSNMGNGMNRRAPWNQLLKDYPLPAKTGRSWTLQEALSAGTGVVNYHGEGKGGTLAIEKPTPKGENYKKYAAQYSEKLEAKRTFSGCFGGTIMGTMADLGLTTADLITGLAQFFATKAFDTELVCPDPAKPNGSCLNLGKVIGGTGSEQGGIIGALTSSVYMPLLVIAVTIAAGWILYIGIVKRRIREALIGTIWILLSVIIGLAFLLNPSLLAKAPLSVSNVISTCVIGAFNGNNCMNNSSTGDGIDSDVNSSKNICRSSVNGATIAESMMMTTNAITCSIWKAFVLEPYAQISFGMSFEDLDTKSGAINSTVTAAGMTGDQFCVDLYSQKSYTQMEGKTLELKGGNSVCNILAYQMYLQVDAKSGSETPPANGTMDDRWYKVVAVAAANDAVWSHWSGGTSSGINKIMLSLLAVITSALGSFIIIVTSVFALVYYIAAVMLMAFAPVFLLIGIHPGRGKKIMFGWFEKVISNILKYFVSAVFLVTTLVIYGGILSSATNMGLILMFVIIITMALFLYRQELMNLLGRANMGGEQLSGALSTSLGNMAQGVGRSGKSLARMGTGTATAVAGGAAGAFIASGGVSVGERLKNTGAGMKDAGKRHLSRQGGLVGNVARQYDRSSVDNQRDLRQKAQNVQQEFIDSGNDKDLRQKDLDKANRELSGATKGSETDEEAFNSIDERMNEFRTAENETLDDMRSSSKLSASQRIGKLDREIDAIAADDSLSPEQKRSMTEEREAKIASIENNSRIVLDFANYQGVLNELQEAKMNFNYSKAIGDEAGMAEQAEIIDAKTIERDDLYNSIGAENVSVLSRRYNSDLQDHLTKQGIQSFSNEDFNEYQDLRLKVKTSQDEIDSMTGRRDLASIEMKIAEKQELRNKMIYETYDSTVRDLKPGQSLQQHDLDKMYAKLDDDLYNAGLSEDHILSLQSKADELRAETSDFSMPYLNKVDGRMGTNVPSVDGNNDNNDDDPNPPLDNGGSDDSGGGGGGGNPPPPPFGNNSPMNKGDDLPIPSQRVNNDPQSDLANADDGTPATASSMPSDSKESALPNYDEARRHRKTQENDPMPTPVDPNQGNYNDSVVEDRYAPPAENEVLPMDPKDDRNSNVSRNEPVRQPQNFTPPSQREVPSTPNTSPQQTASRSPKQSESTNKSIPSNKIPPPPYAPDTPMPTPVDPNEGNYDRIDDRFAPPAEDEVIPKDNKNDRKEHVNRGQRSTEKPTRARDTQPVRDSAKNSSIPSGSMFNKLSEDDEQTVNDYFAQQQELLMDDEEENTIPKAKNEKQSQVRDNFLKAAQDARSRNRDLRGVNRPRRSLPTSPNEKEDN